MRHADDMRVQSHIHHHPGLPALFVEHVELLLHASKAASFVSPPLQQREVIDLDGIGQPHDRPLRSVDHVGLVVVHQVAPELDAVLHEEICGVLVVPRREDDSQPLAFRPVVAS